MSEYLQAEFAFFKAGQGAFYGGRISSPETGQQWTIVYDCGTKSEHRFLVKEIEHFQNNYSKGVIDVLFISHFDYDHVSGVKILLQDIVVKRIVIPQIPDGLRKYSLLSFEFTTEGTDEPNGFMDLDEYGTFLTDPVQYFRNLMEEGGQIDVIVPGEGDDSPEYRGYDPEQIGLHVRGTTLQEVPGYLSFRNDYQVFIGRRWEFTTYVKDVPDNYYQKLKLCLNGLLAQQPEDLIELHQIKTIIIDKDLRTQARDCYNNLPKAKGEVNPVNAYGMVLLHGPVNFEECIVEYSVENDRYEKGLRLIPHLHGSYFYEPLSLPFPLATLLMGDTSLKDHRIQFPKYFMERMPIVHLFQVPHHGSEYNWDVSHYEQLEVGRDVWARVPIHICNWGVGNTYGHPSHEVLSDLGCSLVHNTQFTRFEIRYDVLCK